MALNRVNARPVGGGVRKATVVADRLAQIGGDERGFSLIMVAVSLTALLGA